jgi:hypothetical protein
MLGKGEASTPPTIEDLIISSGCNDDLLNDSGACSVSILEVASMPRIPAFINCNSLNQ